MNGHSSGISLSSVKIAHDHHNLKILMVILNCGGYNPHIVAVTVVAVVHHCFLPASRKHPLAHHCLNNVFRWPPRSTLWLTIV